MDKITYRGVLESLKKYGMKIIGLPLTMIQSFSLAWNTEPAEEEEKGIAYRQSVLDELANKYGRAGLVPLSEFEEKASIANTRDDLVRCLS